jgi:acetyl esterase/lipase
MRKSMGLFVIGLAFLAGGAAHGQPASFATSPSQPADGPGGAAATHQGVIKKYYGQGNDAYWLYEPDSPKPATAPLIVFLHGWSATNPGLYGAWIDHLVRRGAIVVYPRYQADDRTPVPQFLPSTVIAVKQAIAQLQSEPGHVRPELDHCAVVGHSMGGVLAANLAATAAASGLPEMKAVMCAHPGKTDTLSPIARVQLLDLSRIPADTLLLGIAGDRDELVGEVDARRIVHESSAVPAANKNLLIILSDDRGRPALIANHGAPCAPLAEYDDGEKPTGPLAGRLGAAAGGGAAPVAVRPMGPGILNNALDYYGYWKLFDGLCDAAFFGENRQYALGNTPEQRYMGTWSDKTPVTELRVVANP